MVRNAWVEEGHPVPTWDKVHLPENHEELPEGRIKKTPGRPSKYPWDKWMDGNLHTLVRGRDFQPSVDTFRNFITQKAGKSGVRVVTSIWRTVDKEGVDIQFYVASTPPARPTDLPPLAERTKIEYETPVRLGPPEVTDEQIAAMTRKPTL